MGERGASAKQKERVTAKNTTAVYKRSLLLKLESPLLLLILRMGIERKKTKTRRPSWRRAASEQRRCAKQLIPLAGSKPARSRPPHTRAPPPRVRSKIGSRRRNRGSDPMGREGRRRYFSRLFSGIGR